MFAVYCAPTFRRVPPSIRSNPEYLLMEKRLVSSKMRLWASSFGKRPICVSFGRMTSWAMGSMVCVPQE